MNLAFLTDPVLREHIGKHLDHATLRLADHHQTVELTVHSAAVAHALADALRQAAHHLEQAAMDRANRLDQDAAKAMNIARLPDGKTLRLTTAAPGTTRVMPITVSGCECTRWRTCARHDDGNDVA